MVKSKPVNDIFYHIFHPFIYHLKFGFFQALSSQMSRSHKITPGLSFIHFYLNIVALMHLTLCTRNRLKNSIILSVKAGIRTLEVE